MLPAESSGPIVVSWRRSLELVARTGLPTLYPLVVVHMVDEIAPIDPANWPVTLSDQVRAGRFRADLNRGEHLAGRAIVRSVVAAATNRSADSIMIESDSRSKPVVPDEPGIAFNISHSSGRVACAFLRSDDIGVDVERLERTMAPDPESLVHRVCSPAETAAIIGPDGHADPRAFIRTWTRKEAVLKALGDGLALDPRTVAVTALHGGRPVDVDPVVTGEHRWRCRTATVGDCFLSVAWPADSHHVVRS